MPTLTGDKLLYITLLIGDFETNIKTKCFLLKLSSFPYCEYQQIHFLKISFLKMLLR